MLPKEAIEMTWAATAQPGQLFRAMVDHFRVRHLGNDFIEASVG